jgi:4-hydroxybutyryl-CoA dehydratase / vinylacetyl-CoA-Delta-isomerase
VREDAGPAHQGDRDRPGKWTFARDFSHALETIQDLASGLLVTGRRGTTGGRRRSARTSTSTCRGVGGGAAGPAPQPGRGADDQGQRRLPGGVAVHAEGSIEAEKLAMLRAYDAAPAVAYAMRLAGLSEEEG